MTRLNPWRLAGLLVCLAAAALALRLLALAAGH